MPPRKSQGLSLSDVGVVSPTKVVNLAVFFWFCPMQSIRLGAGTVPLAENIQMHAREELVLQCRWLVRRHSRFEDLFSFSPLILARHEPTGGAAQVGPRLLVRANRCHPSCSLERLALRKPIRCWHQKAIAPLWVQITTQHETGGGDISY